MCRSSPLRSRARVVKTVDWSFRKYWDTTGGDGRVGWLNNPNGTMGVVQQGPKKVERVSE